jgi:hypothetical protein
MRGLLGASLYQRTGLPGPSSRRIEDKLVCYHKGNVITTDNVDKAREVFQTALEFFGDEEEQIEKAQVSLARLSSGHRADPIGRLFCFRSNGNSSEGV